MDGKTTQALDHVLQSGRPEGFGGYISDNREHLVTEDRPFASYMRKCIRDRGLRQQDVFLAADIPQRYGYKLISGEKHTRQRDYIIRLCLASRLGLHEAQTALKLYGMSPLYSRIPRDAALMIAFNTGMYDTGEVDGFLKNNGLEELKVCREADH